VASEIRAPGATAKEAAQDAEFQAELRQIEEDLHLMSWQNGSDHGAADRALGGPDR
jgi:hypothetical protein